jgi:arylsulfatase A-like enzyme
MPATACRAALLLILAILSPSAAAQFIGGVGGSPQGLRSKPALRDAVAKPERPNLVLLIADDFGVDMIGAYAEGTNPPCTPNMDLLAAGGLLFRNAWSNPVCSPTRAALLTGRHGFRTGIGGVVMPTGPGLALTELTLPEILPGYASAAVGKWHLAGALGNDHPNDGGFDSFAGTIAGGVPNYSQWVKVVDGQSSPTTTYATTDTVNEAIAAMQSMPEPWFLYVAFHAPHTPWHVPSSTLCPTAACPTATCATLPPIPNNRQMAKSMVEALDTEIGRLLVALQAEDPQAKIVFMGDNGTAAGVSQPPFSPAHAKGSLFEGGVNVPLIVTGPGVVPGECQALVTTTDLFATFADLAGARSTAEDSVSLVPYFSNAALSLRDTVYAETFAPNGGSPPFPSHSRAIRDARYKLIRITGQADAFFDLLADPFETADLMPGLSVTEQAAYDALAAELVELGVD